MGAALNKEQWPECLKGHEEVKGVYVGGCIIGHDKRFYRSKDNKRIAFAHAHTKGKHKGWICVPYKTRLRSRYLMLHELAHVKTRSGHTREWRKVLMELGGTLKKYNLPGSTLRTKDHRTLVGKLLDWFTNAKISAMPKMR